MAVASPSCGWTGRYQVGPSVLFPPPATASAEGAQLNGRPSLWERVRVRGFRVARSTGELAMTFEEILDQAIAMLQRRGRVTYRALKRQFDLDDAFLEDLTEELIHGQQLVVDEDGKVLVWAGAADRVSAPAPQRAPLSYTPS